MFSFDQNTYHDLSYLGCASDYWDEIMENIDQIQLLHTFNSKELTLILHYLHCYAAPAGYQLFSEGAVCDHLIILLSGEVSIHTQHAALGSIEKRCEVGLTLGETAMVDRQRWHATCITAKPVDFAVLTREALNQLLMHHSRLGNKLLLVIMGMMATRINQYDDVLLPTDALLN